MCKRRERVDFAPKRGPVKSKRAPLEKARGFHLDRNRSVGYLMRESSRALMRALEALTVEHDVTLGQFFVMRELWNEDGLTQRDLSGRLGLVENSTNQALDVMEERGLIERRRSTEDRRRIHIWLSQRGRALRGTLLLCAVEINERGLAGFTLAEIETFKDMLRRVRDNMLED